MDDISTLLDDGQEADILAAVMKLAPVFQALIPYDFMVGVTDRERFIGYFPARDTSIKLPISVGQRVPETDCIAKAMQSGKIVSDVVPKEVFGVPFKSSGIAIKDRNGNVIGGIGIGVSLSSLTNLQESSQRIAATSQEITASTEELAATASKLLEEFKAVLESGNQVMNEVKKSDEILQFIHEIAANSNLLGLNAAIEAARAGDQGKGFAVVAEEIRKMAVNSASSVKEIKQIITGIAEQTGNMLRMINTTANLNERQAAATEEIGASMQELAQIAMVVEQATHSL